MKLFCIIFSFIICDHLYAQTDNQFWFAAPDVSSAFGYDNPVRFVITAYNSNSTVTVSIPSNPAFIPIIITVPSNTSQFANIPTISDIECSPANTALNKGILITATNNVSVYYEANVGGPNPELFALKGKNAIGNSFVISSQYILDNSSEYNPRAISSFNIVATEDNTNITILPKKDIVGHAAGVPFTITLNKGQCYAAIATSQLANDHLHGSTVNSTKPIAITLADDLLNGGVFGSTCRDLAGDQTVPVNILGSEYIAIRSNLNSPNDKVYITAVQNGTSIIQDGNPVTVLNATESVELTINANVTYIKSSLPVYAYQLSGSGCEVGSAILPKIICTGSTSVSVARSSNEEFAVCLLVKSGGQNSFAINGNTTFITGADFSVVPGTAGNWFYTKKVLPTFSYPNGTVIRITNSTTLFQEGVLQGNTSGNAFGYFSDFNTLFANANAADTVLCAGETLQLLSDFIPSAVYSWTGPAGFSSNQSNPSLANINSVQSGPYILTVTVAGCGTYKDTINIRVNQPTSSVINQTICEGQSFLGFNTTGTYNNIYVNSIGCDSIRTLNLTVLPRRTTQIFNTICIGQNVFGYTNTGIYRDTLVGSNGCDSIRILNLTVLQRFIRNVNASICQGENYLGYTTAGIYVDTLFSTTACDTIRTINLTVNPVYITQVSSTICEGQNITGHTTTGIYRDTLVSSNGCDSIRTLTLTVLPKSVSNISNTICAGQNVFGYTSSGIFRDTLRASNGCDSIRILSLVVLPRSLFQITSTICAGQSLLGYTFTGIYNDTLVASNGCDSIRTLNLTVLQPIRTTQNVSFCIGSSYNGYTTPGIYNETYTNSLGCDSIVTINLTQIDVPRPDLGLNKEICLGDKIILNPGVFATYLWSNGSTANTIEVNATGIYSVTVTNQCGAARDNIDVTVKSCELKFPSAFTPDGNSINDYFYPLDADGIRTYKLSIFNRWGELVFESSNIYEKWDGNYRGKKADAGAYVWHCEYITKQFPQVLKGTVMLIR